MEISINKKDKVLIVAPHQDDETIGCGGFLAKYGKQCDVLLLTDGSLGNVKDYKDLNKLVEIRNMELNNSMSIVRVKNIFRLPIKNEELNKNSNLVKTFDISKYSYIFIPYRFDEHPDHKACYRIFKSMIRYQKSNAKLIEYEVWTPLKTPTWFLDISDVIETKKLMLKQYKSQKKDKDYLNGTIGLNKYRGIFRNYKYAEAYMDSRYSGLKVKLYELLPDSLKNKIKEIIK